jgi:hypothetical protein
MSGVARALLKTAGIGVAAYAGAVLVVPCMWVGYQSYRVSKWAFKHPNLSATVVLGLGTLWYASSQAGCARPTAALRGAMESVADTSGTYAARFDNAYDRWRQERVERAARASLVQDAAQHVARVPPPVPPAAPTTLAASNEAYQQQSLENLLNADGAQVTSSPTYNFYFVQQGDSPARIAAAACGSSEAWTRIAEDNAPVLTNGLIRGLRLAVRKSCIQVPGSARGQLYTRLPALSGAYLRSGMTLRDQFGAATDAVIALNNSIGLKYTASDRGEKIVWYDQRMLDATLAGARQH